MVSGQIKYHGPYDKQLKLSIRKIMEIVQHHIIETLSVILDPVI